MWISPAGSQPGREHQLSPLWLSAAQPRPSPHTFPSASPSVASVSSLHLWETSVKKHAIKYKPCKQSQWNPSGAEHESYLFAEVIKRRPALTFKKCWFGFCYRSICCLPAGRLAAVPLESWSCFSVGPHCSETVWVREEMRGCHTLTCTYKVNGSCNNSCDSKHVESWSHLTGAPI